MKDIAEFLNEVHQLASSTNGICSTDRAYIKNQSHLLLIKYENELIYLETKKNYKENGIYEDNETSSNDLQ